MVEQEKSFFTLKANPANEKRVIQGLSRGRNSVRSNNYNVFVGMLLDDKGIL